MPWLNRRSPGERLTITRLFNYLYIIYIICRLFWRTLFSGFKLQLSERGMGGGGGGRESTKSPFSYSGNHFSFPHFSMVESTIKDHPSSNYDYFVWNLSLNYIILYKLPFYLEVILCNWWNVKTQELASYFNVNEARPSTAFKIFTTFVLLSGHSQGIVLILEDVFHSSKEGFNNRTYNLLIFNVGSFSLFVCDLQQHIKIIILSKPR